MKTKNIAMLVNDLLVKEVGNVSGSDTTYFSENTGKEEGAFLINADNEEVEVELLLRVNLKK